MAYNHSSTIPNTLKSRIYLQNCSISPQKPYQNNQKSHLQLHLMLLPHFSCQKPPSLYNLNHYFTTNTHTQTKKPILKSKYHSYYYSWELIFVKGTYLIGCLKVFLCAFGNLCWWWDVGGYWERVASEVMFGWRCGWSRTFIFDDCKLWFALFDNILVKCNFRIPGCPLSTVRFIKRINISFHLQQH